MDRRDFLRHLGLGAAIAAASSPLRALSTDADARFLAHVHPELRPIVERILPIFRERGSLGSGNLAKERAASLAYAPKPASDIAYSSRQIPGNDGRPPVEITIVNDRAGGSRPVILHMHGGGFVSGSAKQAIASLQAICRELDCVAVTVDYRIAPETSWRGSTEDNYTALRWVHDNAGPLGVDRERIALLGESAGGGHAALLAIMARDRGEVPIAFQCLVYPMLDDRTGSTRPVAAHMGQIAWTAESNRFGWESFLGAKPGGAHVPEQAVPARTRNLSGLPPAWIGVGSIDLFVDEDIEYARRLNDAGVEIELLVIPGAFHGFDAFPKPTKVAEQFTASKIAALRRGLGLA